MNNTEMTESDGNTSFLRAARNGQLEKVLEHLKTNIDINTSNANGLNALHLSSKDGHVEIVEELLKRGAIVDAATKKGNTALHIASLAGQEEVVKLLIQHGASVNVQSQNGFTPLYMAAQENHDNVVKFLLANGANQSLSTEDGFTPLAVAMQQGHDKVVTVLLENDTRGKVRLPALHIAAKKDDVRAAKLLLENDHNPDVTSKSGFTPLHIASHYGNQPIANLLIQKGADVNYSAKHNITPLHVAAKWGKSNMVALLLEQGAHIEAKTRDGLTPLHCAARSGHEQVVDMLLERSAPISSKTKNGLAPLHMAAQGDHVDAARILLFHRAPVDEVTVDYLTALHVAAHCGHVRVAKLLLDRQADANARALNGFTPLHIACKKNRIKVVELLLKHGACIGATTESGLTPLHVASFMGCMHIVIYLLQHDANPDIPTVRGETPLHLAARANQTDIIRILLRNGAQVDARAREQQTPLHIASRLGNVDIVMLLLQHGAKVDNTTKDMYTALHIAAKEGQDEVAAALIENGASLNSTTKKGFTPLHLAAKYGHLKVAKLLVQKEAPVDAQGKNGVTPLHVAAHYDHQNVALLLLEKGASPQANAKNGHTPLHIAARKNQMDIAHNLLEYGADPNAESKAGFTPLHLSSQEGHTDISALLLENKASSNQQSKNGLTPMHLCAQENKVGVAEILHKNGAELDVATKAGYTPLHIACHFGQTDMVKFLLSKGANVKATTSIGYTPLHQAAQQGHTNIVNILLENSAQPNAITNSGQTPLHIAQKLGYITVIDTLKKVTDSTPTTAVSDEKYRVVAPEAMQETFLSDSEEEGEDTLLGDQTYRYLTADEMKSLGDDSLPIDVTRDERIDSNRMVGSDDPNAFPPRHIEDSISPEHIHPNYVEYIKKTPDNIDISRHPINIGKLHWKNFLVSFLVDARGGAMRGCRHSGIRIIVPPRCAPSPTRITCRYVRPQRTPHPPPLMEGEALASRVLELGPVGAKFLGPVIIEVPHFAALRGKEREIVILRSDNGETWKEHIVDATEDVFNDILKDNFDTEDLNQFDDQSSGRTTRIITQDFPQYFAVISRIKQEVHAIGPEGGMVSSTVVPQVQAVFPQGALTKKIKVGLQAQPIDPELTAKLLGHGVAVSPVVTVEPRRRKFHKAITLSMPAPRAHSQGMINQYSGSAPTLRLLCSITGGTSRAQWEDVTGSTPLTFVNDCVSFTTTVSARFWLMDCRNIGDATKMATELYREAIHVPFIAKFAVFSKRIDPLEARLRVFCMTDDKEEKTLEYQEQFTEIAKSRDVEVLEGKSQFIEFAGNLVPITKSGEQLQFTFRAFKENRMPFSVRVKDQHAEAVGRCLFMREPKVQKGEPPQQPICILNIVLPDDIVSDTISLTDSETARKRYYANENFDYYRQDPRLADMSNLLGEDWVQLANQLDLTSSEINVIKAEYPDSVAKQAQSMLRMWLSQSGNRAQSNTLENALLRIGREDVVNQCLNLDSRNQIIRIRRAEQKERARLKDDHPDEKEKDFDKYSAEEKIFEPSDEEEDFNKTVPERREQIVKRLSIERTIPASSQRVEIVQEISSIKRQSLVEDKIAEVQQKANIEPMKLTMVKPVSKIVQEKKALSEAAETKTTPPSQSAALDQNVLENKPRTFITEKVEISNERRDSDLLEEVTQRLESKKPIPRLITTEDPRSPKLSKTPPPSPADFAIKEKQATTIQEWDAPNEEGSDSTTAQGDSVRRGAEGKTTSTQNLNMLEGKMLDKKVDPSIISTPSNDKTDSIPIEPNAFTQSADKQETKEKSPKKSLLKSLGSCVGNTDEKLESPKRTVPIPSPIPPRKARLPTPPESVVEYEVREILPANIEDDIGKIEDDLMRSTKYERTASFTKELLDNKPVVSKPPDHILPQPDNESESTPLPRSKVGTFSMPPRDQEDEEGDIIEKQEKEPSEEHSDKKKKTGILGFLTKKIKKHPRGENEVSGEKIQAENPEYLQETRDFLKSEKEKYGEEPSYIRFEETECIPEIVPSEKLKKVTFEEIPNLETTPEKVVCKMRTNLDTSDLQRLPNQTGVSGSETFADIENLTSGSTPVLSNLKENTEIFVKFEKELYFDQSIERPSNAGERTTSVERMETVIVGRQPDVNELRFATAENSVQESQKIFMNTKEKTDDFVKSEIKHYFDNREQSQPISVQDTQSKFSEKDGKSTSKGFFGIFNKKSQEKKLKHEVSSEKSTQEEQSEFKYRDVEQNDRTNVTQLEQLPRKLETELKSKVTSQKEFIEDTEKFVRSEQEMYFDNRENIEPIKVPVPVAFEPKSTDKKEKKGFLGLFGRRSQEKTQFDKEGSPKREKKSQQPTKQSVQKSKVEPPRNKIGEETKSEIQIVHSSGEIKKEKGKVTDAKDNEATNSKAREETDSFVRLEREFYFDNRDQVEVEENRMEPNVEVIQKNEPKTSKGLLGFFNKKSTEDTLPPKRELEKTSEQLVETKTQPQIIESEIEKRLEEKSRRTIDGKKDNENVLSREGIHLKAGEDARNFVRLEREYYFDNRDKIVPPESRVDHQTEVDEMEQRKGTKGFFGLFNKKSNEETKLVDESDPTLPSKRNNKLDETSKHIFDTTKQPQVIESEIEERLEKLGKETIERKKPIEVDSAEQTYLKATEDAGNFVRLEKENYFDNRDKIVPDKIVPPESQVDSEAEVDERKQTKVTKSLFGLFSKKSHDKTETDTNSAKLATSEFEVKLKKPSQHFDEKTHVQKQYQQMVEEKKQTEEGIIDPVEAIEKNTLTGIPSNKAKEETENFVRLEQKCYFDNRDDIVAPEIKQDTRVEEFENKKPKSSKGFFGLFSKSSVEKTQPEKEKREKIFVPKAKKSSEKSDEYVDGKREQEVSVEKTEKLTTEKPPNVAIEVSSNEKDSIEKTTKEEVVVYPQIKDETQRFVILERQHYFDNRDSIVSTVDRDDSQTNKESKSSKGFFGIFNKGENEKTQPAKEKREKVFLSKSKINSDKKTQYVDEKTSKTEFEKDKKPSDEKFRDPIETTSEVELKYECLSQNEKLDSTKKSIVPLDSKDDTRSDSTESKEPKSSKGFFGLFNKGQNEKTQAEKEKKEKTQSKKSSEESTERVDEKQRKDDEKNKLIQLTTGQKEHESLENEEKMFISIRKEDTEHFVKQEREQYFDNRDTIVPLSGKDDTLLKLKENTETKSSKGFFGLFSKSSNEEMRPEKISRESIVITKSEKPSDEKIQKPSAGIEEDEEHSSVSTESKEPKAVPTKMTLTETENRKSTHETSTEDGDAITRSREETDSFVRLEKENYFDNRERIVPLDIKGTHMKLIENKEPKSSKGFFGIFSRSSDEKVPPEEEKKKKIFGIKSKKSSDETNEQLNGKLSTGLQTDETPSIDSPKLKKSTKIITSNERTRESIEKTPTEDEATIAKRKEVTDSFVRLEKEYYFDNRDNIVPLDIKDDSQVKVIENKESKSSKGFFGLFKKSSNEKEKLQKTTKSKEISEDDTERVYRRTATVSLEDEKQSSQSPKSRKLATNEKEKRESIERDTKRIEETDNFVKLEIENYFDNRDTIVPLIDKDDLQLKLIEIKKPKSSKGFFGLFDKSSKDKKEPKKEKREKIFVTGSKKPFGETKIQGTLKRSMESQDEEKSAESSKTKDTVTNIITTEEEKRESAGKPPKEDEVAISRRKEETDSFVKLEKQNYFDNRDNIVPLGFKDDSQNKLIENKETESAKGLSGIFKKNANEKTFPQYDRSVSISIAPSKKTEPVDIRSAARESEKIDQAASTTAQNEKKEDERETEKIEVKQLTHDFVESEKELYFDNRHESYTVVNQPEPKLGIIEKSKGFFGIFTREPEVETLSEDVTKRKFTPKLEDSVKGKIEESNVEVIPETSNILATQSLVAQEEEISDASKICDLETKLLEDSFAKSERELYYDKREVIVKEDDQEYEMNHRKNILLTDDFLNTERNMYHDVLPSKQPTPIEKAVPDNKRDQIPEKERRDDDQIEQQGSVKLREKGEGGKITKIFKLFNRRSQEREVPEKNVTEVSTQKEDQDSSSKRKSKTEDEFKKSTPKDPRPKNKFKLFGRSSQEKRKSASEDLEEATTKDTNRSTDSEEISQKQSGDKSDNEIIDSTDHRKSEEYIVEGEDEKAVNHIKGTSGFLNTEKENYEDSIPSTVDTDVKKLVMRGEKSTDQEEKERWFIESTHQFLNLERHNYDDAPYSSIKFENDNRIAEDSQERDKATKKKSIFKIFKRKSQGRDSSEERIEPDIVEHKTIESELSSTPKKKTKATKIPDNTDSVIQDVVKEKTDKKEKGYFKIFVKSPFEKKTAEESIPSNHESETLQKTEDTKPTAEKELNADMVKACSETDEFLQREKELYHNSEAMSPGVSERQKPSDHLKEYQEQMEKQEEYTEEITEGGTIQKQYKISISTTTNIDKSNLIGDIDDLSYQNPILSSFGFLNIERSSYNDSEKPATLIQVAPSKQHRELEDAVNEDEKIRSNQIAEKQNSIASTLEFLNLEKENYEDSLITQPGIKKYPSIQKVAGDGNSDEFGKKLNKDDEIEEKKTIFKLFGKKQKKQVNQTETAQKSDDSPVDKDSLKKKKTKSKSSEESSKPEKHKGILGFFSKRSKSKDRPEEKTETIPNLSFQQTKSFLDKEIEMYDDVKEFCGTETQTRINPLDLDVGAISSEVEIIPPSSELNVPSKYKTEQREEPELTSFDFIREEVENFDKSRLPFTSTIDSSIRIETEIEEGKEDDQKDVITKKIIISETLLKGANGHAIEPSTSGKILEQLMHINEEIKSHTEKQQDEEKAKNETQSITSFNTYGSQERMEDVEVEFTENIEDLEIARGDIVEDVSLLETEIREGIRKEQVTDLDESSLETLPSVIEQIEKVPLTKVTDIDSGPDVNSNIIRITEDFVRDLKIQYHPDDCLVAGDITRTVSDLSGHREKYLDESEKISEKNIDLSDLQGSDAETSSKDVLKSIKSDISPYVTSPTMVRRACSQKLSNMNRPQITEIYDERPDDQSAYVVTEPTDSDSNKRKPLFRLESDEDSSPSIPRMERRDSAKSNVIETLGEERLEDLITELKSQFQTGEGSDSTGKRETVIITYSTKTSKPDPQSDLEIIDGKLRDLGEALDVLEQFEKNIEDGKTEKKLKRVERKFERMASEIFEPTETASGQTVESPISAESKQYQQLVSQLSTDEVMSFQKEYSTLWDEYTFSKSDEWDSKTPDSQADVIDLPQGDSAASPSAATSQDPSVLKDQTGNASTADRDITQTRQVANQQQLSDEMKKLLEEMERTSNQ